MKKIVIKIMFITIIMSYFFTFIPTFAINETAINLEATVTKAFNIRSGPGTNYSAQKEGANVGQDVTISKYAKTNDGSTGCETGVWFYVTTYSGWVCTNGLAIKSDYNAKVTARQMEAMNESQFEQYLISEGFPTSYWSDLKALHAKYPSWVFRGVNTYRLWNNIVRDESEPGTSTYYITPQNGREAAGHEAYLNTNSYYDWTTDLFRGYDGYGFLANEATVAYFLDPRNFLKETDIFMFQGHFYTENTKYADIIRTMLSTDAYTSQIINAGIETNISPIALASRIKQEGTIGKAPTEGRGVTCLTNTPLTYANTGDIFTIPGPLYNFYNIGAHAAGTSAQLNGLCYAGFNDVDNLRPWNTIDKALKGGAMFIGKSYIYRGQYSTYFQKFNVDPSTKTSLGHQYMTNIEDPKSTSNILYNQYNRATSLNSDFVFHIPYFLDMPNEKSTLPPLGNPNNWLKEIKVNGNNIANFSGDKTDYTLDISDATTSIKIDATTVAKTSYLSVNGNTKTLKTGINTININNPKTEVNIVVTAANNTTKTYKITINKPSVPGNPVEQSKISINNMISNAKLKLQNNFISGFQVGTTSNSVKTTLLNQEKTASVSIKAKNGAEKTDQPLSTGDIITITSNNETKSIEIVIYADLNGDGAITIKDLLSLQKHILGDEQLSSSYLKAADVNKDGNATIKDLLDIQKTILGDASINQL